MFSGHVLKYYTCNYDKTSFSFRLKWEKNNNVFSRWVKQEPKKPVVLAGYNPGHDC